MRATLLIALLLAVIGCEQNPTGDFVITTEVETDDDTADETEGWDPSPPTEPGSVVETSFSCGLLAEPRIMVWVFNGTSWTLDKGLSSDPVWVSWLPEECVAPEPEPLYMSWTSEEIEWGRHWLAPSSTEDVWMGEVETSGLPSLCIEAMGENWSLPPMLTMEVMQIY